MSQVLNNNEQNYGKWVEKGRNLTSTLNTTISPARTGSLPMRKNKISPWNEISGSHLSKEIQVILQTEVTVVCED